MENIASKEPINKQAFNILQPGIHFEPEIKNLDKYHWKIQPPIKSTPKDTKDLTGLRKGRFVVIGMLDNKKLMFGSHSENKRKGGWWIVKCDCGCYEIRRKKSILKIVDFSNRRQSKNWMCCICRKKDNLKKDTHSKRLKIYGTLKDIE